MPGTPDMSLWDIINAPEKTAKEEKVAANSNFNPAPEVLPQSELEVSQIKLPTKSTELITFN